VWSRTGMDLQARFARLRATESHDYDPALSVMVTFIS
jgi:hypothetical protein